jgi:hypothetical protein
MGMGLNEYIMEMFIIGITLLLGSAWIFIGIRNPEEFLKRRDGRILNTILGEDDAIKLSILIGKISFVVGVGLAILILLTYLFEL